jgi:putative DNA primase/helicase
MAAATLTVQLARLVCFERQNPRGEWKEALPSQAIVHAILERGDYPARRLVGIIETPTVRPDGSLLSERGYDQQTGYLLEPNVEIDPIPDAPTQEDARRALAVIADVFADFPFTGDAERSVPVAALLTVIARPGIDGAVPAFLFDASTPGSGKSLCADVVAMIATGRGASKKGYSTKDDENEKVLGAYALRGAAIVTFDNINGAFGGSSLERVVSATGDVEQRILGKSEVPSVPWRATILGTGNNISVVGDMRRRVMLARMVPEREDPELRTGFRHPRLLEHVLENRPKLVHAALIILRASS